MANTVYKNTFNYLIPSAGTTSAYTISFPGSGEVVNFGQIGSLTGKLFVPSGVQIDNTRGGTDVTVTINPIGFRIVCPAGAQMGLQFPSMMDQYATFQGGGSAIISFVDYPVMPYLFK